MSEDNYLQHMATKFLRHLGSVERLKNSYDLTGKDNKTSDSNIGEFVAFVLNLKFEYKGAEILGDFEKLSEIEEVYNSYADNEVFNDLDKNIFIEVEDGQLSASIESPLLRQSYLDYRDSTLDLAYDETQFHNSLIISMVIGLEILIAEIFKDYIKYMDISEQVLKDKKVGYSLLKEIGSVEEARVYLIDLYLENLLRNSFPNWLEELKKTIKIDMERLDCVTENIKLINETIQRRHLIIHNDGVVNDLYLNKIDISLKELFEKGESITSDSDYINSRINTFRNFGLILIYQYGMKKYRNDIEGFFNEYHKLLILYLKDSYESSRYIFNELSNNENLSTSARAICNINYFLTYKFNNDDSIDSEIMAFNAEEYGEEFILAKKLLLKDEKSEEESIKYLNEIDIQDFINTLNWPLFKLVNKTEAFKGFLKDKRLIPEAPDPFNVMKLIDATDHFINRIKPNNKEKRFRTGYDKLSEICHPNSFGYFLGHNINEDFTINFTGPTEPFKLAEYHIWHFGLAIGIYQLIYEEMKNSIILNEELPFLEFQKE